MTSMLSVRIQGDLLGNSNIRCSAKKVFHAVRIAMDFLKANLFKYSIVKLDYRVTDNKSSLRLLPLTAK